MACGSTYLLKVSGVTVTVKRTKVGENTQIYQEEGHVKTEAETELQAKECWELLAATGSSERSLEQVHAEGLQKEHCQHFDFWLLAAWTVRECISVVLSHQVCGYLLQQPWPNTVGTKRGSRNCPLPRIHWGTSCVLSQWRDLMTPIHGFSRSWTQLSDWTTQITTALSGVRCAMRCVLVSYRFYAWYQ